MTYGNQEVALCLRSNSAAVTSTCPLCGATFEPPIGPALFVADGWAPVCGACGREYAPDLQAMVDHPEAPNAVQEATPAQTAPAQPEPQPAPTPAQTPPAQPEPGAEPDPTPAPVTWAERVRTLMLRMLANRLVDEKRLDAVVTEFKRHNAWAALKAPGPAADAAAPAGAEPFANWLQFCTAPQPLGLGMTPEDADRFYRDEDERALELARKAREREQAQAERRAAMCHTCGMNGRDPRGCSWHVQCSDYLGQCAPMVALDLGELLALTGDPVDGTPCPTSYTFTKDDRETTMTLEHVPLGPAGQRDDDASASVAVAWLQEHHLTHTNADGEAAYSGYCPLCGRAVIASAGPVVVSRADDKPVCDVCALRAYPTLHRAVQAISKACDTAKETGGVGNPFWRLVPGEGPVTAAPQEGGRPNRPFSDT